MNVSKVNKELDERTRDYLNELLAKDPNDLNKENVAFLLARAPYLDKEEIKAVEGTKAHKELQADLKKKADEESKAAKEAAKKDEDKKED